MVGINTYDDSKKNLTGCLNDVTMMSRLLVNLHGYQNVRTMTNACATKRNILEGLSELVETTREGDASVFYYSGHGAQIPNKLGTEADYFDECLVSHDHDWSDPLRDDDIRDCLKNHRQGANITLIFDCCHSAGLDDGDFEDSRRSDFHPPEIIDAWLAKKPDTVTNTLGKKQSDPSTQRHVLLSACHTDGKAIERTFRGGRRFGLFTYQLLKFSRARKNKQKTWRDCFRSVAGSVRHKSKYKQNPVLTCSVDNSNNKIYS